MAQVTTYLKNAVFALIMLQLALYTIKNLKSYYGDFSQKRAKVGVVSLKGQIMETQPTVTQLKSFFKDPEIKAVVLKIDSSGGSSAAAQAIFQAIKEFKQEYVKTVIAFTENICASAAYYVACAADHIIAQPSTLVGSVGVYIAYPNLQDFIKQWNIKYTVIETGTYKAGGMMFKDLTPEQQAMLQALTDDTYAQFVQDVITCRPVLADKSPKLWADGKVFTGRQALELGLVDELGSYGALHKVLYAKAPIEGEITFVHPRRSSGIRAFFSSETEDDEGLEAHAWVKPLARELLQLLKSSTGATL